MLLAGAGSHSTLRVDVHRCTAGGRNRDSWETARDGGHNNLRTLRNTVLKRQKHRYCGRGTRHYDVSISIRYSQVEITLGNRK